ncbi:IclR family transcriptional regulator [Tropicibacter naphthalenivorans]|uniref:Pca regulon regulatory protein n=1 Tax=Tropicibacter naphthalenivorans TaxID=441103 RepID=A0A0P1GGW3_9RHOB|nr:IclR family transcriptional regulator [Tropicibacter naphthalenivorans]CUH81138.1 Pca regulon regulatory protein [Tropicibacter naphthalenivorans]SMC97336.1 transcriptional regulator, IclR family [Tropicibacter naphthalenivorans]
MTETKLKNEGSPHPSAPARVFASRSLESLEEEYGEDRKFIWSVARAMQILQAFRLRDGAMGNNELSESTGIAKATVTRLTHTLTELGYLKRDNARKYYPSPTLLTLGYTVLGKLRVRQMAQAGMQEIATASNASVALAWPEEDTMVYVAANAAPGSDGLLLDVGARIGMANTSVGRAYLACLPDDALAAKYARWEVLYGAEWPAMKDRIERAIEQVRTRGFCMVDREWRSNVRAVATPVYDADHQTYMAMNCGGPAFVLDPAKLEQEYGPRLVHLAAKLGWRSPW